ncbi:hypothetical protein DY218_06390 [Streptomyces triticagri]|uniref:Uncharacterized protein n=1 Tax=Streptomyces triticagri TaxID=2293568 RepID=A0A372M9E8_9ACTN|nr:hypothetical protein [Streptomyces triticagri]RFU87578.1 hypothetical protein DY218_06390 [Streptomyces triticagri]
MRTSRSLHSALIAVTALAAVGLSAAGALAAPAATDARTAAAATAHGHHQRTYVKTVKLRDGSTVKVYKLGKRGAQADIWAKGRKAGTLTAKGRNADADHNGLHIRLSPNGTVTSWADRAEPKPKPKPVTRVLVRIDTLEDGSAAKVYRLGASHFQADIHGSAKIGTLDADGRAAYGQNNGLHIALQPDGSLTSWNEDAGSPAPEAPDTPTGDTGQVGTPAS